MNITEITDKGRKKYNEIMFSINREYLTIGTDKSQNTENWNLRDMVSEMKYTLDIYADPQGMYWEEAHDPSQPKRSNGVGQWYYEWMQTMRKMERFIDNYARHIGYMECHEPHNSNYD